MVGATEGERLRSGCTHASDFMIPAADVKVVAEVVAHRFVQLPSLVRSVLHKRQAFCPRISHNWRSNIVVQEVA
jgi:hypothetical protein